MLRELLPYIAVLPATAYSLLTLWCGWSFFEGQGSRVKAQSAADPAITILKPVKGMDEGSYENFASFCCQDYKAPVQILFAVAAAEDPAIEAIRQLMADFPDNDIGLSIDPALHGPNLKVSNLINAFPMVKHDIIIICDSDIRVLPTFLSSVTENFNDPEVGLVTSPYCSSKLHGPVTALEALAFTCEMTPNVLTALKLEGLSFALGASMAVRRKALEDIGGLQSLANYLADDYQLGNKIFLAGWKLSLDHQFVESMMKPERLPDLLARQLRWARTMRVSRPGGYLASGITLPGTGLLLAFLAGKPLTALMAMALLYAVRITVSCIYSRVWIKDRLLPFWWWLLPLRDIIAMATWLLAFLGNRVTWRGQKFRIAADGTMFLDTTR